VRFTEAAPAVQQRLFTQSLGSAKSASNCLIANHRLAAGTGVILSPVARLPEAAR